MAPTQCSNCAANAVHHGIIVQTFWSDDRGPCAKLITCKGSQEVCTGTEVTVGDLLMYKQHPTFGLRLEEPITKIVPAFQDLEVFDGGLTLVAVFSYTFPDLFLQRARNGKPVAMNHDVLCKMVFPQPQLLDTKCEYKIAVAYYELTNARGIPFVAIGYRPAQSDRFQKFDFTSLQNENAREDCDAIFRKFDEEYTKSRSGLQAREAAEITDLDIISFDSSPSDSAGPSRLPPNQPAATVRGPSGRPQQPLPAPAWSGSGTSPEMVNAADLDDQPAPTIEPPQFSGDESDDDEEESISFRRVARADRPQPPPQPAARPQARDSDYVLQRASMILEHIVQTEGQPPQQPQQQQPPQQQQQPQSSGRPTPFFGRITRLTNGPAAPQQQETATSQPAAQPPSERQQMNAPSTIPTAAAPPTAPVVPSANSNAPPPRPAAPPTRPSVPPARPAAPLAVQRAQSNAPSGQPTIPSDPLTREDQDLARLLMGDREDVRAAPPNVPLAFPRDCQYTSMYPQHNSVAEAYREVRESLPQGWQPPVARPENWREIPAFRPPQNAAPPAGRPPQQPPSAARGEGSWTIPYDFDEQAGAFRPRPPQWNDQVNPGTMRMQPAGRHREDRPRFAPRQQEAARPFADRYSREFAEDTHQRYDHFGGRPAPRQPPARRPQQPAGYDRRRVDEDGFARRGEWSWAPERTAPSNSRRERPPQRRISPATAVRSMTADELFAVITKDQMCGLYAQMAAFGNLATSGGPPAAFSQAANRADNRGERGGLQSARNRDDRRPTREVRVISGSIESDEDPAMVRSFTPPAASARRTDDRRNANVGGATGGQRGRQSGERPAAQPRAAGGYTRGNFSASDDESEDEEEFEDARSEQHNGNRAAHGNAHGSPLDFIESSGDEA
ncbi:hypothetical protein M3Y99_00510200 [Aphelenchoides fujianensis]|nr:hypothetical protein M3Y99_00510200 [Aphelenchoides fujianensis]